MTAIGQRIFRLNNFLVEIKLCFPLNPPKKSDSLFAGGGRHQQPRYASIASHSFGVRLRTRYVRLPIPNLNQIQSLTTKLSDFEKQGLSKMMRLPFGPTGAQAWQLEAQRGGAAGGQSQLAAASGSNGSGANGASQKALPDAPREALPETCLGEQGDLGFGREDQTQKIM